MKNTAFSRMTGSRNSVIEKHKIYQIAEIKRNAFPSPIKRTRPYRMWKMGGHPKAEKRKEKPPGMEEETGEEEKR